MRVDGIRARETGARRGQERGYVADRGLRLGTIASQETIGAGLSEQTFDYAVGRSLRIVPEISTTLSPDGRLVIEGHLRGRRIG